MNILGDKIMLRAIEKNDLDILRSMQNDQSIEEMCGSWDYPLSQEGQLIWYENILRDNRQIRLMIDCIETKKTIGTIYLSDIDWKNRCAFLGIKTIPGETRNRGYGIDAILTLLRFSFEELQMHRIESFIISYNNISLSILDKLGLKPEGTKRECFFSKGQYFDKIYVSILDREYYNLKKNGDYK